MAPEQEVSFTDRLLSPVAYCNHLKDPDEIKDVRKRYGDFVQSF